MSLDEIGKEGRKVFKEVLGKLKGIKFFVFSGTALGLYRDGDLILSDTDIDFIVPEEIGQQEIIKRLELDTKRSDEFQLTFRHSSGIMVDFLFYRDDGEHYALPKPHYFPIEKYHLDKIDWRKTKYGKVPFPNDVEKLFEQKYGEDWTVPKYQQKRVGI